VQQAIASLDRTHKELVNEQIAHVRAELLGVVSANIERLNGMDRATDVLATTVSQVPTNLQTAVHELNNSMNLRFQGVDDHFTLIDKATERQRHDAELAASALARAQERSTEALAAANTEAIRRSDEHTADKIQKNEESQLAGQKSLSDKIDLADQRMGRLEQAIGAITASAVGVAADREQKARSSQLAIAVTGVLVAVILGVLAFFIGSNSTKTTPQPTPVEVTTTTQTVVT